MGSVKKTRLWGLPRTMGSTEELVEGVRGGGLASLFLHREEDGKLPRGDVHLGHGVRRHWVGGEDRGLLGVERDRHRADTAILRVPEHIVHLGESVGR